MRRLVIDTATEALSLALFEDEALVAAHHELVGRGHSERLIPLLAAMPERGRADAILVDVGPGSFTGVRIGLAAARALGFAWDVPVRGYGSLALVAAMAARGDDAPDPLTVVMTGGHGELFWQRFDRATLTPLAALASTPIAALAATLADERLFGSGAETLVAARGRGRADPLRPDARRVPLLPAHAIVPAAALYGRGADARPMAPIATATA